MTIPPSERFERVRALGQGATGSVYEVFDRVKGARCALKQLRTDRSVGARQMAAFKDEFRSLTRIVHPNFASVYELVAREREIFVLMELIDGVDFLQHVRGGETQRASDVTQSEAYSLAAPPQGGSLSLPRLRAALPQLASGILALHAAGRTHRDLKPGNILVERSGRVVIVDYGLVTVRTRQPLLKFGGTPHYMAPEQSEGWASEASDWYAFGVVLYLALTGRLPFDGPGDTVQYEKRFRKPVPPEQLAADLPHDLCALCLELLAPDPRKRPSGEAVARRLGIEPAHTLPSDGFLTFVGRKTELQTLETALADARAGHTRVVYLHGESGIGKTTLLGHFLEAVRQSSPDTLILQGTCYESASVSYKGLDAVMDTLAAHWAEHAPRLREVDLHGVAAMFPVFAPATGDGARSANQHPLARQKHATEAVRALFGALASASTVVLAIDDLQWTDPETVRLLAEIVRPPSQGALLVILSHRSAQHGVSEAVRACRSAIADDHDLPIGALPHEDVEAVASGILERTLLASELAKFAAESTGNPLLLRQFALARAQSGDEQLSLDDVVSQRLAALKPKQRAYVELVAQAGRPIDEDVLARILGSSGAQMLMTRQELLAQCLIRSSELTRGAVESYHDQIRLRVLRALPVERARHHHARLAAELEARPDTEPEVLSYHFHGAGDRMRALFYLERAGNIADRALAFDRASRLFGEAARLAEGAEVDRLRIKHAEALSNAGHAIEAAETFLESAQALHDPVDWKLRAGDELLRAGALERGLDILRQVAIAIGEPLPESDARTQLAVLRHGWALRRIRVPVALKTRQPTATEQRRLAVSLTLAQRLAMVDTPNAVLFTRKYLELALDIGTSVDVARGIALEASFSTHMPRVAVGGPRRAAKLVACARSLLTLRDAPSVRANVLFAEAMIAYSRGRWRECRERIELAVEVLRREVVTGVRWDVAIAQTFIAYMAWVAGDLPAARRQMPGFRDQAAGHLSLETALIQRVEVMLLLCDDAPTEARRLARATMARWPESGWQLQHYLHAFAEVEIDLYTGDPAGARATCAHAWAQSEAAGIFQQRLFVPFARAQRARTLLAAASPGRALPDILTLRSSREPWVAALGTILLASLWATRGEHARAARLLEDGARALRTWEMRLFELAARARLAALRDDARERSYVTEALAALGVRRPDKLVAAILPWPTERPRRTLRSLTRAERYADT